MDQKRIAETTGKITILFIKVLASLISRYSGVIGQVSVNPRRFGFQLRDLTLDMKIRSAILDLLCIQNSKDHIASHGLQTKSRFGLLTNVLSNLTTFNRCFHSNGYIINQKFLGCYDYLPIKLSLER